MSLNTPMVAEERVKRMTKIINLFGGPGCGKSTTAAQVFSMLKQNNINCELVTEFAKQLTWSERFNELACQPYVFGKQLKNLSMLIGKVDVIITDSPVLLSIIYTSDRWPNSFKQSVLDIFNSFDNTNYFLKREKQYNPKGRNQTLEEAINIDGEISKLLQDNKIPVIELRGNSFAVDYIFGSYMENK